MRTHKYIFQFFISIFNTIFFAYIQAYVPCSEHQGLDDEQCLTVPTWVCMHLCAATPRHYFCCPPPSSLHSPAQQRLFVCTVYLWNEDAQDSSSVSSWLPLKPPEHVVYFMGSALSDVDVVVVAGYLLLRHRSMWTGAWVGVCVHHHELYVTQHCLFSSTSGRDPCLSSGEFLVPAIATVPGPAAIWLEYWCAMAVHTARPFIPSSTLCVATASLIFTRLQLTNLISSQWRWCWCRSRGWS